MCIRDSSARAENQEPSRFLPVQAHGRQDLLVEPERRRVGLDLVAYLHRRVHRIQSGAGENDPIREQHRGCPALRAPGKTVLDEASACVDRTVQLIAMHALTLGGGHTSFRPATSPLSGRRAAC